MRIYRRGTKWAVDYIHRGRRFRKVVGSKKIAEAVLADVRVKIEKEEHLGVVARPEVPLEKHITDYLQQCAQHNRASTCKRKREILNLFIAYCPPGLTLSRVTPQLVDSYISDVRERTSGPNANRHLATLRHLFNEAVRRELTERSPVRVKPFKENPHRQTYLTKDEAARLIEHCPDHLRPIVITALNTGMRKGEILALSWRDVDLLNRKIHIRDSKSNRARSVPINPALHRELSVLAKCQRDPEGHLFTFRGRPVTCIRTAFENGCRRAGLSDVRFHDLRHTFASHLVMAGVDLRTVADLLGHSKIEMTMRYAHLAPELLSEATDTLNFGENEPEVGTEMTQGESETSEAAVKPAV